MQREIMTLTKLNYNCVYMWYRVPILSCYDRHISIYTYTYLYSKYFVTVFCPCNKSRKMFYSGALATVLSLWYFQDSSTIRHIYHKYFSVAMWSDRVFLRIIILEPRMRLDRFSRINSTILVRTLLRSHPEYVSMA